MRPPILPSPPGRSNRLVSRPVRSRRTAVARRKVLLQPSDRRPWPVRGVGWIGGEVLSICRQSNARGPPQKLPRGKVDKQTCSDTTVPVTGDWGVGKRNRTRHDMTRRRIHTASQAVNHSISICVSQGQDQVHRKDDIPLFIAARQSTGLPDRPVSLAVRQSSLPASLPTRHSCHAQLGNPRSTSCHLPRPGCWGAHCRAAAAGVPSRRAPSSRRKIHSADPSHHLRFATSVFLVPHV